MKSLKLLGGKKFLDRPRVRMISSTTPRSCIHLIQLFASRGKKMGSCRGSNTLKLPLDGGSRQIEQKSNLRASRNWSGLRVYPKRESYHWARD